MSNTTNNTIINQSFLFTPCVFYLSSPPNSKGTRTVNRSEDEKEIQNDFLLYHWKILPDYIKDFIALSTARSQNHIIDDVVESTLQNFSLLKFISENEEVNKNNNNTDNNNAGFDVSFWHGLDIDYQKDEILGKNNESQKLAASILSLARNYFDDSATGACCYQNFENGDGGSGDRLLCEALFRTGKNSVLETLFEHDGEKFSSSENNTLRPRGVHFSSSDDDDDEDEDTKEGGNDDQEQKPEKQRSRMRRLMGFLKTGAAGQSSSSSEEQQIQKAKEVLRAAEKSLREKSFIKPAEQVAQEKFGNDNTDARLEEMFKKIENDPSSIFAFPIAQQQDNSSEKPSALFPNAGNNDKNKKNSYVSYRVTSSTTTENNISSSSSYSVINSLINEKDHQIRHRDADVLAAKIQTSLENMATTMFDANQNLHSSQQQQQQQNNNNTNTTTISASAVNQKLLTTQEKVSLFLDQIIEDTMKVLKLALSTGSKTIRLDLLIKKIVSNYLMTSNKNNNSNNNESNNNNKKSSSGSAQLVSVPSTSAAQSSCWKIIPPAASHHQNKTATTQQTQQYKNPPGTTVIIQSLPASMSSFDVWTLIHIVFSTMRVAIKKVRLSKQLYTQMEDDERMTVINAVQATEPSSMNDMKKLVRDTLMGGRHRASANQRKNRGKNLLSLEQDPDGPHPLLYHDAAEEIELAEKFIEKHFDTNEGAYVKQRENCDGLKSKIKMVNIAFIFELMSAAEFKSSTLDFVHSQTRYKFHEGERLMRLGVYARAIDHFSAAIEICPSVLRSSLLSRALLCRAECYSEGIGSHLLAIRDCSSALKYHSPTSEIRNQLFAVLGKACIALSKSKWIVDKKNGENNLHNIDLEKSLFVTGIISMMMMSDNDFIRTLMDDEQGKDKFRSAYKIVCLVGDIDSCCPKLATLLKTLGIGEIVDDDEKNSADFIKTSLELIDDVIFFNFSSEEDSITDDKINLLELSMLSSINSSSSATEEQSTTAKVDNTNTISSSDFDLDDFADDEEIESLLKEADAAATLRQTPTGDEATTTVEDKGMTTSSTAVVPRPSLLLGASSSFKVEPMQIAAPLSKEELLIKMNSIINPSSFGGAGATTTTASSSSSSSPVQQWLSSQQQDEKKKNTGETNHNNNKNINSTSYYNFDFFSRIAAAAEKDVSEKGADFFDIKKVFTPSAFVCEDDECAAHDQNNNNNKNDSNDQQDEILVTFWEDQQIRLLAKQVKKAGKNAPAELTSQLQKLQKLQLQKQNNNNITNSNMKRSSAADQKTADMSTTSGLADSKANSGKPTTTNKKQQQQQKEAEEKKKKKEAEEKKKKEQQEKLVKQQQQQKEKEQEKLQQQGTTTNNNTTDNNTNTKKAVPPSDKKTTSSLDPQALARLQNKHKQEIFQREKDEKNQRNSVEAHQKREWDQLVANKIARERQIRQEITKKLADERSSIVQLESSSRADNILAEKKTRESDLATAYQQLQETIKKLTEVSEKKEREKARKAAKLEKQQQQQQKKSSPQQQLKMAEDMAIEAKGKQQTNEKNRMKGDAQNNDNDDDDEETDDDSNDGTSPLLHKNGRPLTEREIKRRAARIERRKKLLFIRQEQKKNLLNGIENDDGGAAAASKFVHITRPQPRSGPSSATTATATTTSGAALFRDYIGDEEEDALLSKKNKNKKNNNNNNVASSSGRPQPPAHQAQNSMKNDDGNNSATGRPLTKNEKKQLAKLQQKQQQYDKNNNNNNNKTPSSGFNNNNRPGFNQIPPPNPALLSNKNNQRHQQQQQYHDANNLMNRNNNAASPSSATTGFIVSTSATNLDRQPYHHFNTATTSTPSFVDHQKQQSQNIISSSTNNSGSNFEFSSSASPWIPGQSHSHSSISTSSTSASSHHINRFQQHDSTSSSNTGFTVTTSSTSSSAAPAPAPAAVSSTSSVVSHSQQPQQDFGSLNALLQGLSSASSSNAHHHQSRSSEGTNNNNNINSSSSVIPLFGANTSSSLSPSLVLVPERNNNNTTTTTQQSSAAGNDVPLFGSGTSTNNNTDSNNDNNNNNGQQQNSFLFGGGGLF